MSALVVEWSCFNVTLLKRKEDLAAAQEGGLKSVTSFPV